MYKIIIRTIFYHWFILLMGIAIGFIANSEWVGEKYIVVDRSIRNIFFPIKYDENVERFVRENGKLRLWSTLGCPNDLVILDDVVKGEEYYWALYTYTDQNGKKIKDIGCERVRWKTWEYYYKIDEIIGANGVVRRPD